MPAHAADIDAEQVEQMAMAGATNGMIADVFCVDEATIRRRFPEIVKKARALRRIELLKLQWQAAQKGNPALLIWLGKNELGQLDAPAMPVEEKKPTELRIVRPGDVKAAEA